MKTAGNTVLVTDPLRLLNVTRVVMRRHASRDDLGTKGGRGLKSSNPLASRRPLRRYISLRTIVLRKGLPTV